MKSSPDQFASHLTSVSPCVAMTYRKTRPNSRNSFIAPLLPHLFPVSPVLHYSFKKMGGGRGVGVSLPPTSCLELPTSGSRPIPPLRNCFVFNTFMKTPPNAPLSKSFRICDFLVSMASRPYPPLSKSFVFNTVSKTLQKAPLSNSFRLNRFQTSCKAPLSKSFVFKLLQKNMFFLWSTNY